MKILIGIPSCLRDRERQNYTRIWLKDCERFGVDYKFFLGGRQKEPIAKDEIHSDRIDDNYDSLIEKVKWIIQYALDNGYEYLFKCDVDTFANVYRLIKKSGFEKYGWSGSGVSYGGTGYWLSRERMLELLARTTPLGALETEDVWVHRVLQNTCNHRMYSDTRYHSLTNVGPASWNAIITVHQYMDGNKIIRANDRFKDFEKFETQARSITENE